MKRSNIPRHGNRLLRSVIRIGFHERRLQYMEKDLINQWKQSRQSERILEIDAPLSYGILGHVQHSRDINKCEFVWDPSRESGIYIKVGSSFFVICFSTSPLL